jgi:hypothetical protein
VSKRCGRWWRDQNPEFFPKLTGEGLRRLLVIFDMSPGQIPGVWVPVTLRRAVTKEDATLLAKESGDHSMIRIRLVGHLDMMPERLTAPPGLFASLKSQPEVFR